MNITDNDRRLMASEFVDKEVDFTDPDIKAAFDEELLGHPAFEAQVLEWDNLRAALRRVPPPELPRPLGVEWDRFLAARDRPRPELAQGFWEWLAQAWPSFAPAFATAALAIAVGILTLNFSPLAGHKRAEWRRVHVAEVPMDRPLQVLEVSSLREKVAATAFSSENAGVIWISGIEYRPKENPVQ